MNTNFVLVLALAASAITGAARSQEYSAEELLRRAQSSLGQPAPADALGKTRSLVLEDSAGGRPVYANPPPAPSAPAPAAQAAPRVDAGWKQVAAFNKLGFGLSSSTLTPETAKSLNEVARFMNAAEMSGHRFMIAGNTDATGKRTANLRLSARRAKAVVEYLVLQGVEAKRLVAKGYGQTRPLPGLSATSPENRRVDLLISG